MPSNAIDSLLAEETGDSTSLDQGEQLSTAEIRELRELKSEVEDFSAKHGDWRSLKTDYVKKSQRLSELEGRGQNTGAPEDPETQEQLAYLKKMGVITKEDYQEGLARLEEQIAERDERDMVEDLRFEIDSLAESYSFVKPRDLLDFMAEQADNGTNLSPEQASRLLYFDQFSVLKSRGGRELPTTDASSKGSIEAPVGESYSFKNKDSLKKAMMDELEASGGIE